MKTLNEEINNIKRLYNYNKGDVLREQEENSDPYYNEIGVDDFKERKDDIRNGVGKILSLIPNKIGDIDRKDLSKGVTTDSDDQLTINYQYEFPGTVTTTKSANWLDPKYTVTRTEDADPLFIRMRAHATRVPKQYRDGEPQHRIESISVTIEVNGVRFDNNYYDEEEMQWYTKDYGYKLDYIKPENSSKNIKTVDDIVSEIRPIIDGISKI